MLVVIYIYTHCFSYVVICFEFLTLHVSCKKIHLASMCVYMYVYAYMHILYIYIYVYIWVCVRERETESVCVRVDISTFMYIDIVCIYIHVYACTYAFLIPCDLRLLLMHISSRVVFSYTYCERRTRGVIDARKCLGLPQWLAFKFSSKTSRKCR